MTMLELLMTAAYMLALFLWSFLDGKSCTAVFNQSLISLYDSEDTGRY